MDARLSLSTKLELAEELPQIIPHSSWCCVDAHMVAPGQGINPVSQMFLNLMHNIHSLTPLALTALCTLHTVLTRHVTVVIPHNKTLLCIISLYTNLLYIESVKVEIPAPHTCISVHFFGCFTCTKWRGALVRLQPAGIRANKSKVQWCYTERSTSL